MSVKIAEFLASVGFQADKESLNAALGAVAKFSASVSVLAGGVFASLVNVAQAEVGIAAQADKLGMTSQQLQEMRFVAEQTGSSAETLSSALESIAANNPRIRNTAEAFDLVSRRMQGMSDIQRKLYAQKLGIDPSLIPMMAENVDELRQEFRAMYATAGMDAQAAAEASSGFLAELGKLKTLAGMLSKAVSLAFIGQMRQDVENLRRAIMENFAKIQRVFQIIVGFILRVAGAVGALVYRVVSWASSIMAWFDSLDEGQRKLVVGLGLLIAAWKMLNLSFLATPIGLLITGLAAIVALVDDYLTFMEGGESYFDWSPWADTIQQCVQWLKNAISTVGNFLTAHQDMLKSLAKGVGIFLSLRASLGAAVTAIGSIRKAFSLLSAALSANPWMLVLTAAIMAATLIIDNWDAVKAFFLQAWATIKNYFAAAIDFMKAKFPNLTAAVSAVIDGALQCFSSLKDFVVAIFTGDFSGALDAAVSLFANFGKAVWNVFFALGRSILNMFGLLWGKVVETFPNFGAWAESAGKAIKGAFGKAIGWVKEKIRGLTALLPDWVLDKIGLKSSKGTPVTENTAPSSEHAAPSVSPREDSDRPAPPDLSALRGPDFDRAVLAPTPSQQASMTETNKRVSIEAKTEINVSGSQNPAETAQYVAKQQDNVNADLVRHTQGALR